MKTKLFAFIVLMMLPLGMAAQSDPVEARLKAKYGFACRHGDGTSTDPFYYSVIRDGKEGACDANGREIIPPSRYDDVCRLGKGTCTDPFYYSVTRDGKEGACDANGREIIPPSRYDFVCRLGKGTSTDPFYYSVKRDGKYGACDENLREVVPPSRYDFVCRLGKGTSTDPFYYSVTRDWKFGACDENGREVVPPKYDTCLTYSNGVFNKRVNGKLVSLGISLAPDGTAKGTYTPARGYEAKSGVTLETILGKSLLTESDIALLDEGYSSQSTQMKIMDLTQQSNIYDGEDDARAFRFMHEAARLGDCWALYQVGLKYCLGDGTTMDISKGKKCLQKAASMGGYGSEDAQEVLKGLK